ncbi:MAG: 3-hydroxyacyl-CoA dehydrogenase NAD-binding domain-containing protein [Pseudomonadota bacterium]
MNQTNKAVILGGGTMGADIAAIFVAHGRDVEVVETAAVVRETLPARIRLAVSETGQTGPHGTVKIRDGVSTVDWTGTNICIECVSEVLSVKQAAFAELERYAPPDLPLASNSSGLPITRISEGLSTRQRMLGLHFFMPGHLVPAVEVIRGEHTDPAVIEQAYAIMAELHKKPVRVQRDVPGFLANRIQHAMMREAISLVEQGFASAQDVDTVVRYGFGLRYVAAGPLLQKDLAGIDIHCSAAASMYPYLCTDSQPSALMQQLVAEGKIGVKARQGFYEWTDSEIEKTQTRYKADLVKALAILKD